MKQREIDDGFKLLWVDFSETINLLKNSEPNSFEHKNYIIPRDLKFLENCEFI